MGKPRDYWRDPETFLAAVARVVAGSDKTSWPEADFIQALTQQHPASKKFYRWFHQSTHEGWLRLQTGEPNLLGMVVRSGRLRAHPKGYGFVVSQEYPGEDVFVPEGRLGSARHGDQVLVWVCPHHGGPGPEGRILAIQQRATDRVVGRLYRQRRRWFVLAEDRRLPDVRVSSLPGASEGDLVVAQIEQWPDEPDEPATGRLDRRLGRAGDPGMDISILMATRRLPFEFPAPVHQDAEAVADCVSPEDLRGRMDLRDRYIVTIDGSDAKDLDDAISIERTPSGFRVGVHIADVSYYVEESTALDAEARQRGTSVYLVDRVIPMLPERLSNGIASLNPGAPRLTVSAFIELDSTGHVVDTKFSRSVIRSCRRLTYEEVNGYIAGEDVVDDPRLAELVDAADSIRQLRYALRVNNGAVDFDLPEPKVLLDGFGNPRGVAIRQRGPAESIIEECMLLANEAVAVELRRRRLPAIFRVHEAPGDEKLAQFRALVDALGYRLPKKATPKALQSILAKSKGTPEERVIASALLRSMRQARYDGQNSGHFGLASKAYTHFTSPIRRYPDLFVHRVLTEFLSGSLDRSRALVLKQQVDQVAALASTREREAMEAERESVLIKQVQFMADKVGEQYLGIVSGVVNFGLFVELPNLIEGLVRIEELPNDWWVFDPVHYRLRGKRTGRSYGIGDRLPVVVARVDRGLRRIDLSPVQARNRAREDSKRAVRTPRPGDKRAPRKSATTTTNRVGGHRRRRTR